MFDKEFCNFATESREVIAETQAKQVRFLHPGIK